MSACLLCVGSILAALELTMRSLYPYDYTMAWLEWHPTQLYINNPHLPKVYWDTEWNVNSLGFRGPEIGEKKKPRILCLGDSCTFGFRAAHDTCYPGRLQVLFSEYEVLNGGTFGYSSFQGLKQFEGIGLKFKPDIVTIAFGFNDRRYVVRTDLIDSDETFQTQYRKYYLDFLMGYCRLYHVLAHNRLVKEIHKHPPITTLIPRVNTSQYRENIEKIISLCVQRGIAVILIATGDHPEKLRAVEAGDQALERGDREQALKMFEAARENQSTDSRVMGTYYKAITLETMGRFEEAEAIQTDYPFEYYFPGVNPIRTTRSYYRVLEDLAQTYHLPLIYYRSLIHDDPSYYIDECHPTVQGYLILADALAAEIRNIKIASK